MVQKRNIIFASVFGAIVTYFLYTYLGFNNVVAASVTGIFAGLLAPSLSAVIYMGAFVGMVSSEVIRNLLLLIIASILAGLLFIYSKRYFSDFGGKLGLMAFIAVLITVLVTRFLREEFFSLPLQIPESYWIVLLFVLTGAIFSYLTDLVSRKHIFHLTKQKKDSRVLGSAIIGLLAGMIFPELLGDLGMELATLALAASFVGMTSSRLFDKSWEYLLAGGIAGLVFAASGSFFPGYGGKAGAIAFVAVLIFVKIYSLTKRK